MIDVIYLVIGGVALILMIAITVIILKWLKGNIEIIPTRTNYHAGEVIEGRLNLKIRKNTECKRLIVGLRCERIIRTYSQDKKHNIENEDVLFDFNQVVDKERSYTKGDYPYDFSITIPLNIRQQLNGIIEAVINSVQTITGKDSSVRWYVYARLFCKGVDLYKKVQINIF